MSIKDCITAKAKAGKVKKEDADEASKIYDLELEWTGDAAAARARTVEYMKMAKGKKKAQEFLKAQAHDRIRMALNKGTTKEKIEASLSAFESLGREGATGPALVARRKAIIAQVHSKLGRFLYEHRRNMLGKTTNKAGSDDVAREAFDGNTGNLNAKAFNEAVQEAFEYLRVRWNAAGGDIGKHERYGLPTHWDAGRVKSKGVDQFVKDFINRVDWEKVAERQRRSIPDKEQALRDIYTTIATKGFNKKEATAGSGALSLANQRAESRFLELKSGDDWLFLQENYGAGEDVLSIVNAHIDNMAKDIALLESFGPNPKATTRLMQNILVKESHDNLNLTKREGQKLRSTAAFLPKLYDAYTGNVNIPQGELLAKTSSDLRAILTSAQLGGAFLSAISDTWFGALASKFNGVPTTRVLKRHLELFATPSQEMQQIAVRAGLIADMWSQINAGLMRYTGEIPTSEYSRVLADGVIRASGLGRWTQAGRWAFGLEFSGLLADNVGRSFDALPKPLQRSMKRYNISAKDWDGIRGTELLDHNGAKFMALGDIKQQELRTKVLNMIHTETEFAVPSTSLRGRATLQGQPGTWPGEIMNSALMYKNFGITLIHTHLRRAVQQPTLGSKAAYGGALIFGTTMMGALSLTLKDIARGKAPREMTGLKFWLAAMIQGGGMGIFGDFLFQNWTRFGHSPAEAIAGPGIAFGADTYRLIQSGVMSAWEMENKIGGDLIRYVGRYTPGSSLWYTRLAFERYVLDQIQSQIDPKYKKRWKTQANNAERDMGQEYWLPRGELAPSRMPIEF